MLTTILVVLLILWLLGAFPRTGAYNARWFAEIMLGLLDELGIERTHIVGNSMGGRVALEMGLTAPERIVALTNSRPSRKPT